MTSEPELSDDWLDDSLSDSPPSSLSSISNALIKASALLRRSWLRLGFIRDGIGATVLEASVGPSWSCEE